MRSIWIPRVTITSGNILWMLLLLLCWLLRLLIIIHRHSSLVSSNISTTTTTSNQTISSLVSIFSNDKFSCQVEGHSKAFHEFIPLSSPAHALSKSFHESWIIQAVGVKFKDRVKSFHSCLLAGAIQGSAAFCFSQELLRAFFGCSGDSVSSHFHTKFLSPVSTYRPERESCSASSVPHLWGSARQLS